MSEKGLKMVVTQENILKLKSINSEFCKSCVLGKQKVTLKKVGQVIKETKLKLFLSNFYEKTSVSLVGGSRYYVT